MISSNWYVEFKKNPDAFIRLFCFHHSGGGASAYYPWREQLSPDIELVAIQLPGRENRFNEPLTNNLDDIMTNLTRGFHPYVSKPFFVFGHSLGALLGFEFIKAIHHHYSLYPKHLIVSATKAPHLPFRKKGISQLNDAALKEELKTYNGLDERIINNEEILDLLLPIIRNDFKIYESHYYSDSKPLPCDILALSGIHDQTVTKEEIFAWTSYTAGKFKHLSFSGRHFFIKNYQKDILEIINQIGTSSIKENQT